MTMTNATNVTTVVEVVFRALRVLFVTTDEGSWATATTTGLGAWDVLVGGTFAEAVALLATNVTEAGPGASAEVVVTVRTTGVVATWNDRLGAVVHKAVNLTKEV
jgi:hypothetical protein